MQDFLAKEPAPVNVSAVEGVKTRFCVLHCVVRCPAGQQAYPKLARSQKNDSTCHNLSLESHTKCRPQAAGKTAMSFKLMMLTATM